MSTTENAEDTKKAKKSHRLNLDPNGNAKRFGNAAVDGAGLAIGMVAILGAISGTQKLFNKVIGNKSEEKSEDQ